MLPISIIALAAAAQAEPAIVVTASREPSAADAAPASSTILPEPLIERLSLPSAADLLRLTPGVSVATTGPRGTQTQLRLRGAEAGHTLLFVDGIRFNDPAAGNEPRFELLSADLLARLEIVRGPQSALWGAEALGGVIAAETADPLRRRGFDGLAEYGSLDSVRLLGRAALGSETTGVTAAAGWQSSDGIDSFGAGGERDGFDQLMLSAKAVHHAGAVELGAVGYWIEGLSEFDGSDPVTFLRADTLDETENRIGAVRAWARGEWDDWSAQAEVAYLDSANRNRLDDTPVNATFGDRLSLGAQVTRQIGRHRMTAAVDHQAEDFRARDTGFGGATDQERSRSLTGLVGEWRADWNDVVATDLAVRHDSFSAFADATTFRAALLVRPARGWVLHGAYGEGIAQPTFYDLYGFFPATFVGNPALRPERSRAWEVGLRWQGRDVSLGLTGFSARLRDEIIDVFDPDTFLSSTANADGRSRRDGIEFEAEWRHAEWLVLGANYTFIDAGEQRVSGTDLVREVRRPRHSANLVAHGESGRLRWGASLAYVGARRDTDFDLFPARTVSLGDYALASLNVGWRVLPQLELYGRIENAFDSDYQDVVGYNTAGRTVHAGLRVAFGD
ncbi:TonB-dependent receptor plug domain-containing protein [Sphingosinicella terrae]|uniref:TonB-dependent receptor plug domain-containing protein n=1 Tax=Sphingosinicella terrae TaxID=2172047 RepID=UPI000E0CD79B|nr:TonB-dependent receptor [Sphingosinicella terrae]